MTTFPFFSGRPYGADDFLPMLTYVLAQCDLPQLDNQILYMMELLDPSLLQGEGRRFLHPLTQRNAERFHHGVVTLCLLSVQVVTT